MLNSIIVVIAAVFAIVFAVLPSQVLLEAEQGSFPTGSTASNPHTHD